jgi:hypothetical protein
MCSTGPRFHIPFPTTFLSVNTPINFHKSASASNASSPDTAVPAHNFLSNRNSTRHFSISSVSSEESVSSSSTAPSPAAKSDGAAPVHHQKASTFLALNSKYESLSPTIGKKMNSSFLSNRV